MNSIVEVLVNIANWFWGIPVLLVIGVGGLYVTLRLGFVQITKFGYICSQTFGKMFGKAEKEGEISPFSAAVAALASSIGASNIVGVPVAIALGGPGAIFWMWVLAIIGCGTKFVEVALGQMYKEKNEKGEWVGGPYYYLKKGIGGNVGKFLGILYAFFLMIELIPSIATQAASASAQALVFGIDQKIVGIIIALIVVVVCVGGIKRIAKVTDLMVPFMAAFYILGALVVIFMNIENVPEAFSSIFVYAFAPKAAVGGFAGSTIALALRWGAARGVYSNEAGMGTAPMAHSSADVDHPIRQAMWGVFEVTVDTLIVCTVTALTILVSGVWKLEGIEPGALAQAAYNSAFGSFGDIFVAICVFLFVLSTIIVVVFYGEKQAEFLFGIKFAKIWRWVYVVAIIAATLGVNLTTLYSLTDFFLGTIIIPNMIAVILLAPKVAAKTKEYFNTPGKYYLADVEAKKARKAKKS
ncbi:MAG: amino acid carrier protein [Anaerovoracaceae bacterium]